MAEYIEREALFEIVEQQGHVTVDDIIAIPAADVAPVVQGEWKPFFGGKEIQCSVCTSTFWNEDQISGPNYCPNCGAMMEV